jgi:hypothetical protein
VFTRKNANNKSEFLNSNQLALCDGFKPPLTEDIISRLPLFKSLDYLTDDFVDGFGAQICSSGITYLNFVLRTATDHFLVSLIGIIIYIFDGVVVGFE